jgi:hypothetical protein
MGNSAGCFRRGETSSPRRPVQGSSSRPVAGRARRTAEELSQRTSVQPLYSTETFVTGLQHIAEYLRRHNQDITIIATGTAWILLKIAASQQKAPDFEYLGEHNITPDQLEWLNKAARHAAGQMSPQMNRGWFHHKRPDTLSPDAHRLISRQANVQEDLLFNPPNGGLRVLSAPLEYIICSKLDMIDKAYSRATVSCPHHHLLHVCICVAWLMKQRNWAPLHYWEIVDWGARINMPVNERVLSVAVNEAGSVYYIVNSHSESGVRQIRKTPGLGPGFQS